jgi:LCP family protein required for cell wall assembly
MQGGEENQLEQQLGQELRRAREKQGLSLEEIEQAASIYAHHLEALERGDFEALPSRAWARGFLCSYANYLGLDGEMLAESVLPLQSPPRSVRYVRHRWQELAAAMGAVAVLVIVVLTVMIVAPYNVVTEKVTGALNRIVPGLFLESGPQRVVILGFPESHIAGSDNILVVKVARDDFGVLAIPGNTLTEIPDHGKRQISDAFELGGPDLTRQAVARLSGTEITYYFLIDAEGVKDIVDTMGGLQIEVPAPVSDRSVPGGPIMTLRPGYQRLNGDQTLVYLQGSDLQDDVKQAKRQQELLYTMFSQALSPGTLIFEPTTLRTLFENVETNMSAPEAIQLASRMRAIKDSDVRLDVGMVPGQREEASSRKEFAAEDYWAPDAQQLPTILKETVQ